MFKDLYNGTLLKQKIQRINPATPNKQTSAKMLNMQHNKQPKTQTKTTELWQAN